MTRPTFYSLFSGVGGLDLAIEAHGFQVVAQVENDAYCTAVLERHWPQVARYGDVTEVDWHAVQAAHGRPDLVAAGFPCQPTSQAGQRKAQADPRWLWPEVARCLRALRPDYVFLENTLGLLSRGFDDVLGGLAALGFDAEWDCFQAADVGAPHERDRVFVLAYRPRAGRGRPWLGTVDAGQAGRGGLADADGGGLGAEFGDLPARQRDPAWRGEQVADPEGQQRRQGGATEAERLGRPASRGIALAVPAGQGRGRPGGAGEPGGRPGPARGLQPGRLGEALEYPDGQGLAVAGHAWSAESEPARPGESAVADADQLGRAGWPGEAGPGPAWPEPAGGDGWRAESRVGGDAPGFPGGLDGHRWPAPPGPDQYPGEPPRTVGKGIPNRGHRVKALGNAVVPQQGALAFGLLWQRMLEAAA